MSVFGGLRRFGGRGEGGFVDEVLLICVMFLVTLALGNFLVGVAQDRADEIVEYQASGEGDVGVGALFGGEREVEGVRVVSASKVGCLAAEEGSTVRCVDVVIEFLSGNDFGAPAGEVLEGRVVVENRYHSSVLWLVPNGMGVVDSEVTDSVKLDGAGLYQVLSDDETLGLDEVHELERERLLGLKVESLDEELEYLEGLE